MRQPKVKLKLKQQNPPEVEAKAIGHLLIVSLGLQTVS